MKVVFPHFAGDQSLLLKHLEWIGQLEGQQLSYHAIMACDDKTDPKPAIEAARRIFAKVGLIRYSKAYHNGKLMTQWPWQQNNSFAHVARAMATQQDCWFWCETDCTALKKGWLQALEAEYGAGGKPFGGHWNPASRIFNGVAVYPANVGRWCIRALMAALVVDEAKNNYQPPWDAYMSSQVEPMLHKMNNVMQHLWSLPDAPDRPPSFPNQEAVNKWIRPEVYLFHRCKDGSLIDRLKERRDGLAQCRGTDVVHPRVEPPPPEPVAVPVIPLPAPTDPSPPPVPPPQPVPEAPLPRKRNRLKMRVSPKAKQKQPA